MLRRFLLTALLGCTLFAFSSFADTRESVTRPSRAMELLRGWEIQSSCVAKDVADKISQVGYATAGWHQTTIPNTVVGTLVDDKTYPDPMVGTSLKSFPGMNYSSATFFALQDMPEGSPFKCSWWWRSEFAVKPPFSGEHFWLHFPGINYRANVWVNGRKIADAKDVAGTYRIFEFDVTSALKTDGQNA